MNAFTPALCGIATLLMCASTMSAAQEAEKLVPDGLFLDEKGTYASSVSVHGDRIIVGVDYEDAVDINSGAAYIFEWDGVEWIETARLVPQDGGEDDHFGQHTAIWGDWALVASPNDDDNGNEAGAVYVFRWNGFEWEEVDKLISEDGDGAYNLGLLGKKFGSALALEGNLAVIGEIGDDDNGDNSGAVYIYELVEGDWTAKAKLTSGSGEAYDHFGTSVALDSTWLFVGIPYDDYRGEDSGSVLVLKQEDGSWTNVTTLLPGIDSEGHMFGISIAVQGDLAVVGANGDDTNGASSGAAYVYRWDDTRWLRDDVLLPDDGAASDFFGSSVAIEGDRIFVGADQDDDRGEDSGSVYVYRFEGGVWERETMLLPDEGEWLQRFGFSMAAANDRIVVVSRGSKTIPGSAYVFDASDLSSVAIENDAMQAPGIRGLQHVYPNPFTESVRISINIPEATSGPCELSIFDIHGRRIRRWQDVAQTSGTHDIVWDAGNYPAGMYVIRLVSDWSSQSRVVVHVR